MMEGDNGSITQRLHQLIARGDRRVLESESGLFETLKEAGTESCGYAVHVLQRGGRPARKARLSLRSMTLSIVPPAGHPSECAPLRINAIAAEEIDASLKAEPLLWVLLTTEPVSSAEQALTVVRHYECRWRIEDYHKAWKSGVGVERQRFQSPENLERMPVQTSVPPSVALNPAVRNAAALPSRLP